MNDDTSSTEVTDLDEKRNQRRVTDALNTLSDEHLGTLRPFIRERLIECKPLMEELWSITEKHKQERY